MPVPRVPALRALVLLAALAGLSACDLAGQDDAGTQTVVSAFLEAGDRLPEVRLSRTVPLGDFYDEATAAIPDAAVELQLLGPAGAVEESFAYAHDELGRYEPVGAAAVLPGRTYRLVAMAHGATLTAETTVPPTFEVVEPLPAEIVYQSTPSGPSLRITTSSTAGRQAVYVATAAALEADEFEPFEADGETRYRSRNLPGRFGPVPFVARIADCEEVGAFLECDDDPTGIFTSGTSPIINESSYVLPGDGTAIVNVPWFSFGFYGPADVSLIALDDAFQDFVETQALQGGGGTLSPGEIPNVTTNVTGGLGVFGSFARVRVSTTILEAGARGAGPNR